MPTLIRTNGSEEAVQPANGRRFTLEELYQHLSCAKVQAIDLPNGKTMWLDEDGKFKDNPVKNPRATILAAAAGTMPGDEVMGDVLITDDNDAE